MITDNRPPKTAPLVIFRDLPQYSCFRYENDPDDVVRFKGAFINSHVFVRLDKNYPFVMEAVTTINDNPVKCRALPGLILKLSVEGA